MSERNEELLGTREIAKRLGLSMVCLQQWRARGRGPKFYKLGPGAVKYKWEDVEAWLAACEVEPRK